jgi:hypothetical protein
MLLPGRDLMGMKEKSDRVAAILQRDLEPTIKEWLRRVNLVPELIQIPLSDKDRTRHLRAMFRELMFRLRLPNDSRRPIYVAAGAHGQRRQKQGYSAAMLVEESPIFQVVTFGMLHLHRSELDRIRLLPDVRVIADEADAQFREPLGCPSLRQGSPVPSRSLPPCYGPVCARVFLQNPYPVGACDYVHLGRRTPAQTRGGAQSHLLQASDGRDRREVIRCVPNR